MLVSVYLMVLLIAAVACTAAVLHRDYDDTLWQRLALSGAAVGAAVEFYSVTLNTGNHRGLVLLVVSLLTFAVARAGVFSFSAKREDHVSGF